MLQKILICLLLIIITVDSCGMGCQLCKMVDQNQICLLCYDDFTNKQGRCYCKQQQYIKNHTNCQDCNIPISYCSLCTNSTYCQQCQIGSHRNFTINRRCQCQFGYFDKNVTVCQTCTIMTGCLGCMNGTYCISCDQKAHRVLNSSVHLCDCMPKYYEFQYICQSCQMKDCLTCNSTTYCQLCDIKSHKQSINGDCKCIQRYFQQNVTCIKCNYGCLKCENLSVCTSCSQEEKFILNVTNNKCDCIQRYYQQNDNCNLCDIGCLICTNSSNCLQCSQKQRFVLDLHSKCLCINGFYLDLSSKNCMNCSQAIQNCLQCQSASNCTKYKQNNTIIYILIGVGVAVVISIIIIIVIVRKRKQSKLNRSLLQSQAQKISSLDNDI